MEVNVESVRSGQELLQITAPGVGNAGPFDSIDGLRSWIKDNPRREIISLVYVRADQSGIEEYERLDSGAIIDDDGERVTIRVMFATKPLEILLEAIEKRDHKLAAERRGA